jgi:DMSO reductase anchor subunit
MKLSRRFLAVLLTLLLLMTQQAAVVHAASHLAVADSSQQDEHLPHEQTCGQCLALAQFAASAVSQYSLPLTDIAKYPPPVIQPVQATLAQTICAFSSRAPPYA